jgi:hypothetical protein
MMIDIDRSPVSSAALIHVYNTHCVLNRAAVALLGLDANGAFCSVKFQQDSEELAAGRDRIYVCACRAPFGFKVKQRNHTCIVRSSRLCRKLMSHLQGQGTYRICAEVNKIVDGVVHYEIFFRKYEKEYTAEGDRA